MTDKDNQWEDLRNERRKVRLTEDQLDYLVKGLKKQIMDEIYADIGKGVVKRILWVLGIGGAALASWLTLKGYKVL